MTDRTPLLEIVPMSPVRPDRPTRAILALVTAFLLAVAPAGPTSAATSAPAATTRPAEPVEPTPPSFVDNDFLPEDVNLSDCRSGVPRPNCGSRAKGGWRQGLVFGAIVAGITFIGWRIARALRAKP